MGLCCFAPTATDDNMGNPQTVVGVKQVKQGMPEEEWAENMPLPGDIIEGIAEKEGEDFYVSAKARSELSSLLARLIRQVNVIWVKVRRGNETLKLRACVVQERCSKLQRRFTIRAAADDRHVVLLADLTIDHCLELQEMSRQVVKVVQNVGFHRQGVKYDWRRKMGIYLPDPRCSVLSSVLFLPFSYEHSLEATTARAMAWFSAAVSSGAPLIFVNVQADVRPISFRCESQGNVPSLQQIVQGVRLWFLPGVAEIPVTISPEEGETRFGMDIKRTEEGFIRVCGVGEGTAADRAGLGRLRGQAREGGYQIILSRLDGKSLMPTTVSTAGLIDCCDHSDVRETLETAIDRMEGIDLHIMAWSTFPSNGPSTLRLPVTHALADACTAQPLGCQT